MNRNLRTGLLMLLFLPLAFFSCKDDQGNRSINIFTVEDDKQLGQDLHEQISEDEENYPMLDRGDYPEAYGHIERIVNTILASGKLRYDEKFDWKTSIIHDDNTLNAFVAPGGYMYVYTGLIHFLESEDELAGVMGHEMAHADRRHTTDRLTRAYGVSVLLDIVLGQDRGALADIAAGLAFLSYGRGQESEADEFSVMYLYETEYDARGVARFFEKLIEKDMTGGAPEFLSSHPNPQNRVQNIMDKWDELGGQPGQRFETRYQQFKQTLP